MDKHTRGVAAAVAALLAIGLLMVAPAATAQAKERRATFAATLKAGRPHVMTGSAVALTGTVKPARKGTKVVLYKRNPGATRWTVEARGTTNARGAFRFVDRPHQVGVRHYRVVVPAKGSVRKGYSRSATITTYAWRSLVKDVKQRLQDDTYRETSVKVGGVTYGPSFVGTRYSTKGYVDWNLDRACLRVRARFGNSDDSDDLSVQTSLVADQKVKYAKSFALAQSEVATVDVTGAFRVAFAWTTGSETGGANAAIVEPEALCAF